MIDYFDIFFYAWPWLLAAFLVSALIALVFTKGAQSEPPRCVPVPDPSTSRSGAADPREPPHPDLPDVRHDFSGVAVAARTPVRSFATPAAKGFDRIAELEGFERALRQAHTRRRES